MMIYKERTSKNGAEDSYLTCEVKLFKVEVESSYDNIYVCDVEYGAFPAWVEDKPEPRPSFKRERKIWKAVNASGATRKAIAIIDKFDADVPTESN